MNKKKGEAQSPSEWERLSDNELMEKLSRKCPLEISALDLTRRPELVDPVTWPWVQAIEVFDKHNDIEPLLQQLKRAIPRQAFPLVRDFFDRYQFKKRRGRSRTPAYAYSGAESVLEAAKDDVEDLKRTKMTRDEAIEEVAHQYVLRYPHLGSSDEFSQTLRNAVEGKRTSTRRMNGRLRP